MKGGGIFMASEEGVTFVRGFFGAMRPSFARLAGRLVEDSDAAVERAAALFEEMIPDMAYVGQTSHPLASSLFGCNAHLAMYLALRERGVDAHTYGRAMLAAMAKAKSSPPVPTADPTPDPEAGSGLDAFIAAGAASRDGAARGEFVFEVFRADGGELDWGMNVTSCAICASYSRYDAMDLVPYMCATDDIVSDRRGEGLRRSGTLAVGAHRCDFRYKHGRPGEHLSERYADRIRVGDDAD